MEKEGGERFHARYILTDIGGCRIEKGLDEGQESGETTDIGLLDLPLYNQRWKEFQRESSVFDFGGEVKIIGEREIS